MGKSDQKSPPDPRSSPTIHEHKHTSSSRPKSSKRDKNSKSSSSSTGAGAGVRTRTPSPQPDLSTSGEVLGASNFQTDEELVHLLRQKPKNVPELRTRESFRRFFAGMERSRLQNLLETSYDKLAPEDRTKKVLKRLKLVEDILA